MGWEPGGMQSVLRSGVVAVSGSFSDAMGVHVQLHGSAQRYNRWWGAEVGAGVGISDRWLLKRNHKNHMEAET